MSRSLLQVQLVVYDLLPPSYWASILWGTGFGLYHSAVRIPALGLEYCYGGSELSSTGIFSLPVPSHGKGVELPGIRFLQTIDMGHFEDQLATAPSSDANEETEPLYPPSAATSRLGSDEEDSESKAIGRFLDLIDHLKQSPKWHGNAYDLFKRNCNHFSDYLLHKSTGRSTPYWLNRAARIAVSFPCLVPSDFLEPPAADEQPYTEIPVATFRDLPRDQKIVNSEHAQSTEPKIPVLHDVRIAASQ